MKYQLLLWELSLHKADGQVAKKVVCCIGAEISQSGQRRSTPIFSKGRVHPVTSTDIPVELTLFDICVHKSGKMNYDRKNFIVRKILHTLKNK